MKYIKIVACILLIIVTCTLCCQPIYAVHTGDELVGEADAFINKGTQGTFNTGLMKDGISNLFNITLTIAIAIAVVLAAVLGIKFLIGSVEEQAEIKQALIPYVAGCIVAFGAFGIWKLVLTLIQPIA